MKRIHASTGINKLGQLCISLGTTLKTGGLIYLIYPKKSVQENEGEHLRKNPFEKLKSSFLHVFFHHQIGLGPRLGFSKRHIID
jgi:hypothetical protein